MRGLRFLTAPSLKTRMAIVAVALVFVTTILASTISLVLAKRGMKAIIGDQQFTLLSQVADEIDQKFYTRQRGLQLIAAAIPRDIFQDSDRLQRFVEQHSNFKVLFDNLSIANAQGELLANLDDPASRGKLNVANRAYFKDTMATRKGVISAPLRSALTHKPVLIMTAPVLDQQGNVALIVGGTMTLDHDNFLGRLAQVRIGRTGYVFAITNDGVIVSHPKQSLVLQQVASMAGSNPGFDHALAGYEGTLEGSNGAGVHGLFSYKRMRSTNWILGAVYPEVDAFTSIAEVEKKALLAAILLGVLVGPLAWWIARRQIAPLQQLHAHIQEVRQHPETALASPLREPDEIGRLARTFDNLMRERLTAEAHAEANAAEMRNNRAFLHSLIDYMPVLVFSKSMRPDNFGQVIMWNKAGEAITGYRTVDVLGRTDREIFPLKMAQTFEQRDRDIVANPAPMEVAEYPFRRTDGSVRYLHSITLPIFDEHDRVEYILGIAEDVTARRTAERALAKSEQRLRLIADNIPALIAYIDPEQRFTFGNRQYENAYGVSREKIEGKQPSEVLGPETYAQSRQQILNVLDGKAQHFERFVARYHRWERVSYVPDIDAQGTVAGFFSLVEDITELKQSQTTLANREKLLRAVTDHLPALVSYIDQENRFQFNNQPHEEWLGRPLSAITGHKVEEVYDEALYAQHKQHFERALEGKSSVFEFERSVHGATHYYNASYVPQFDDGALSGVCTMIHDITALKQVENQLRVLVRFDSLTGLSNRLQFDEKLAEAIARSRRSERLMAVMFLDIDHFKSINDTLGHHGGDEVLREFAQRLLACVRHTDMVARLAGDEFVIILEGLHAPQEATVVAQKIIYAMAHDFQILGMMRNVTTSIGIAIRRDDEVDAEALLRRADVALYGAKAAGRNTFDGPVA